MTAKDGAFDLKATISQSRNSVFHYSRIISQEKKILEDFSATCVVADGRSASVFAAFKLGLPCPSGMKSPFILTILSGHSFSRPIFGGILNIADRFPDINFLVLHFPIDVIGGAIVGIVIGRLTLKSNIFKHE